MDSQNVKDGDEVIESELCNVFVYIPGGPHKEIIRTVTPRQL